MTNLAVTPQPIGIFPLPAGYLLLPPLPGVDVVQTALLQGQPPESWPEPFEFYRLALAGDSAAAHQALAAFDSPEARYNRFVLQADPAQFAALRAEFSGELAQLLEVVAYTLGYLETPPEPGQIEGERLAMVLMAQATAALEQNEAEAAIPLIESAIAAARPVSPLFAAQLLSTLAETTYSQHGPDPFIIQHYQAALTLLEGSSLAETRAEMWLNLGIVYHDLAGGRRGALLEAVKCYQQALSIFSRTEHPEPYALAQNNLALAYLSMPLQEAGDQLRMGIAVQALREALKVYTPESHPEQWASAQLNLANAYQYLPSAHPADNLAQAVELYEAVLAARDPVVDPSGYARVLANQGNALAHLGIFDHAVAKLEEARQIFERQGEVESAQTMVQLLAQIQFPAGNGQSHGAA